MFSDILVVCVGNICRSPMAEALLRAGGPDGVHIHSAGIGALVGKPADPNSVRLMQKRGIDITAHRARQLTLEMLRDAELVLVMETRHQRYAYEILPIACGKIHCLGKWIDQEIPDPYQKSPEYFESSLTLIEQGVNVWTEKLWRPKNRHGC